MARALCLTAPWLGLLVACGGGGSSSTDVVTVDVTANDAELTDYAQLDVGDLRRIAAARAAAASSVNACAPLHPFYWELGNAQVRKASGSVGLGITASTKMGIASASKWLYSAYALQLRPLTAADVPYLNFTSGYVGQRPCLADQTILECSDAAGNGGLDPAAVGKFSYDGAHMQHHAVLNGMGSWDSAKLATEYNRVLGIQLTFSSPWLAAGAQTTAAEYAKFLRRIMNKGLAIEALLGSSAVCTDPATCATAIFSPTTKLLDYSLGHWVEVDLDGAFSSAGAIGFYPWISANKQLYGIVARSGSVGSGDASVDCGRAIRAAWG